ncbi:MAG: hypothetical protein DA330_09570, partial [Nitrososphaera sp.]|nr:hypothetical protein [Nitrososphaera sp.]
ALMSQLPKGEEMGIQLMFQAVENPWAASMLRAANDGTGESFFPDEPLFLDQTREKVSSPLFAASMRLYAVTPDEDRSEGLVHAMLSAMNAQSRPGTNRLILMREEWDRLTDVRLFRMTRAGMILNARELASIGHFPLIPSLFPKLLKPAKEEVPDRTKAVPDVAMGHSLILGINRHKGVDTPVTVSEETRLRHMYIVGATGMGKSRLITYMAGQDARMGNGFAIIDPHGALVADVLESLPPERLKDVILLDPSDVSRPVGFNVLSAKNPYEKQVLSSDFGSSVERFSGGKIGVGMEVILINAINAMLSSPRGGTLWELRRFLMEKDYRKEYLKTVTDPSALYYWRHEYKKTGDSTNLIANRLALFMSNELVRNVVAQPQGLDFSEVMNGKKILLARLSQGIIGVENSHFLASLILLKILQAAMAREAIPAHERVPFFLYLDEFQNFVTPSINKILSEARKYRLGLVLAHQLLSQIHKNDKELQDNILQNPSISVYFRIREDAKRLAKGLSFFNEDDLQELNKAEAIARVDGRTGDCNLNTFLDLPLDGPFLDPDEAKAHSREYYGSDPPVLEMPEFVDDDDEPEALPKASKPNKRKVVAKAIQAEPDDSREIEESVTEELSDFKEEAEVPSVVSEDEYWETASSQESDSETSQYLLQENQLIAPDTIELAIAAVPLLSEGATPEEKIHRQLQQQFKTQAQQLGFRARIEHTTPNGGRVDVLLEGEGRQIAIEINSVNKPAYEVANLRKCLQAGYRPVLMCAVEANKLNNIKRAAKKVLSEEELETVQFLRTDALVRYLSELVVPPQSGSGRAPIQVHGYKVKVVGSGQQGSKAALRHVMANVQRELHEKNPDLEL